MTKTTITTADFVKLLTEIIERRINKCRNEIRESQDIRQQYRLIIEKDRLDWVLAQINSILNRKSNLENMMKQKLF